MEIWSDFLWLNALPAANLFGRSGNGWYFATPHHISLAKKSDSLISPMCCHPATLLLAAPPCAGSRLVLEMYQRLIYSLPYIFFRKHNDRKHDIKREWWKGIKHKNVDCIESGKRFCYFADMLNDGGQVDSLMRVRCAWFKFRQLSRLQKSIIKTES